MLDIAGIFQNRVLNVDRLVRYGFTPVQEGYSGSWALPEGPFQMTAVVSAEGAVSVRVTDGESGEEYVLVHAPGASGAFVGGLIQACEDRLRSIAGACFDYQVFRQSQTKEIIDYVGRAYGDALEFLWEKFPDNGVFRRRDTGKWYAAVLTVSGEKLGLEGRGRVEIIDLRAPPEEISRLVDGRNYFPGYHMNKKHWYTICLDGTRSTREICRRIDASYLLAVK